MKSARCGAGLLMAALFLLAGCAETQLAIHAAKELQAQGGGGGTYKVGKPYQVAGIWYYPKVDPTYDETGLASWYGPKFHGRKTANGDTFDMNALTAAHKTLPMPSRVRVTNLENGRSLDLIVNDRGPFVHGRIIDVSRRAAQLLGFRRKGVAKVRVSVLNGGTVPAGTTVSGNEMPALRKGTVSAGTLAPPPGARSVPSSPTADTVGGRQVVAAREPAGTVDTATIGGAGAGTPAANPVSRVVVPANPTIYVQAGAFSSPGNAERVLARLRPLGDARISGVTVDGRPLYRVRLGPLDSVEAADRKLLEVLQVGLDDARIVIDSPVR